MKLLIHALSEMPVVKLKGDRDPIQVGARRAVIASLCSVIQKSRREGSGPSQGRRLFSRDEAIALGSLFVLAMREVETQDVIASSEELAAGLYAQFQHEATDIAPLDDGPESDLIEAAEHLSNGIVTQLEYVTGELW